MVNYTFGILPTIMRHDARVSDFACRLYSEVDSLSNKYGYCFATNTALAKNLQKSPSQISRTLSELEGLGYISLVIEDGYKRKIYPKRDFRDMEGVDEIAEGGTQNCRGGYAKLQRGVRKNSMTANKIINKEKHIKIKEQEKAFVEATPSTPFLSENEIEDIEQQIYASKATQKPKEKVAPKRKGAADNPTPIREMFDIYSNQYAKMNGGEKPEFMPKYLQPMKKLYGILEARQIQSGIVPLDKLQPWRDFIEMWGKFLQDHPKETYFISNFNPATFYSQFNTIVAKLKNQPKTTAQKWEQFYRENTTG